jgi:hypothetical protein
MPRGAGATRMGRMPSARTSGVSAVGRRPAFVAVMMMVMMMGPPGGCD